MTQSLQQQAGFIVTRQWRDTEKGVELELWLSTASGAQRLLVPGQEVLFFLPQEEVEAAAALVGTDLEYRVEPLELRDFTMRPVSGFYFRSQRQLRVARERLIAGGFDPLEADLNPVDRYLMERFVQGSLEYRQALPQPQVRRGDYQPGLRMLSLDIETAMEGLELYSIGVYAVDATGPVQRVFMRGESTGLDWVELFADEASLFAGFCRWLQAFDPDILIRCNVINFDLWFLQRVADKLRQPLAIGRGRGLPHWREIDDEGERRAVQIPGRAVLDGIDLLRTATYRFESFSLESVARELLGEGKLLKGSGRGEQIGELFREDKDALARYNLRDCELVWDIFEHTDLLNFAVARSQMTGLAIDRHGASVAAFDFLYLPRLHREGFVAPNASRDQVASPGGFVLDSEPGIFSNVLVLDFKSLYPSIIRTFRVDPLGLAVGLASDDPDATLEGFVGGRFSRRQHLLPGIIEELWSLRDAAKSRGDSAQSQAIKIIMNSFYGVLGTPGCRFFDARLASSITRRGHEIIQATRDRINALGDHVIYGDTDSVFVTVQAGSSSEAAERGRWLQRELNQWWSHRLADEHGIDSVLELEFETLFTRFLMPTMRGSEKGSKKRYAGIVESEGESSLVFKGLENVRTDWTSLARNFQRELYGMVFAEEPFEDYIRTLVTRVEAGECDGELVYRKRLRRRLDDYQRTSPPHVQSARLQVARGLASPHRGDWVEYVMTTSGPEPAADPRAPLDYGHYVEKQLAPVADGILHFLGTSFVEITGKQGSLF